MQPPFKLHPGESTTECAAGNTLRQLCRLLLAALVCVQLGCASLSRSECQDANWQALGEADGASGQPLATLSKHHQACARHQLSTDPEAYHRGHERGIALFCNAETGYRLGLDGRAYQGVCPASSAADFQLAYVQGLARRLDSLWWKRQRLHRPWRPAERHKPPQRQTPWQHRHHRNMLRQEQRQIVHWIARWSAPAQQ